MITLNKAPLGKDFGTLEGDYRLPAGAPGSSCISTTGIGSAIRRMIHNFYLIEPNIRILQYAIMPDHVHILLFVEHPTKEILGRIIARFKVEVNKVIGAEGVFAKGFNDQILTDNRSLDTLYKYIRDNPRRLAVRREHPEYFRRVNTLKIGENTCQAYGNFQLLECPFKEQIIVHRADTPEERQQHHALWLYTAANGAVLVSPFISADEKAVRGEAEEAGGRFILIVNEPMAERYKPSGRDFELCEAGRLLIVSAVLPGALSRTTCLAMNELAKRICLTSQRPAVE